MSRQLNLRVSNEFAEQLERVARRVGRPMASVLESVGTPALEAAEADALFEAEALKSWEEYQLGGSHVPDAAIDTLFTDALAKARSVAERKGV